jgi:rhamnosyltransferase
MKKVSIIVRTKNEERWIGACLKAVLSQKYQNFEVVLVDNQSTDRTIEKARPFNTKILSIAEFRPGRAINLGIENSDGDIIVILSGHCIPKNDQWLDALVKNLDDPQVAGVYGRQEPMAFSSALDKRDLYLTFGLDRIVQHKDSFFHNANSALSRKLWEKFPFDEEATNIEDRIWGRQVINAGYRIIYEPDASVFHHHGIHHELDIKRAERIVKILEKVEGTSPSREEVEKDIKLLTIIPHRGEILKLKDGTPLIEVTIRQAKRSRVHSDILLASDNPEMEDIAKRRSTKFLLRPKSLSEEHIGIGDVLQFTLKYYEPKYGVPDLVALLEETHPFRDPRTVDFLTDLVLTEGVDSAIVARREARLALIENTAGRREFLNESFAPRTIQDDCLMIGLFGAGCVTHPEFIRDGSIIGRNLGFIDKIHPLTPVEIRNSDHLRMLETALVDYVKEEKA